MKQEINLNSLIVQHSVILTSDLPILSQLNKNSGSQTIHWSSEIRLGHL